MSSPEHFTAELAMPPCARSVHGLQEWMERFLNAEHNGNIRVEIFPSSKPGLIQCDFHVSGLNGETANYLRRMLEKKTFTVQSDGAA